MPRGYLAFAEICTSSYEYFRDTVNKMNNNNLKQTYNRMKDFCEKDTSNDLLKMISNIHIKYEYIYELMKSRDLLIE